MEPRHVFLVAAGLELGVGAVVVGQGLEGLVHRLVALGTRAGRVEDRRADAAGGGHDGLLGIDGAGQLDELPGLAQLDHLGNLKERRLAPVGLARGRGRTGEDHGVLVEDQVLLQAAGRVGRDHVRMGAVEPVPDGLRGPAGEPLLKGLDRLGPLARAGGDLVDHLLGHAGLRQLFGRGHQRVEQAEVAGGQGQHHHLRGLLGREPLPAGDLAPLDHRDPGPAAVEPAAFIEGPVAVQVVLAIDLEAVLVVAPLVEVLAAVGDDEPAEQLALPVAKRVADGPLLTVGHQLDLAGIDGRRVGGGIVVHARLGRPELEQVLGAVVGRHAPGRDQGDQSENGHGIPQTPHESLLIHRRGLPGNQRPIAPRVTHLILGSPAMTGGSGRMSTIPAIPLILCAVS